MEKDKNIIYRLKSIEAKVCNVILKSYYKPFLKTNYREDLFYAGYLAILEKRKNCENLNENELFEYYYKIACSAMTNKCYKISYEINCKKNIMNLDEKISCEDSNGVLADIIADEKNEFSEDYDFIKKIFLEEFKKYSAQEKKCLQDYFFNCLQLIEIIRKYKFKQSKRNDLINLIRTFRLNLFNKLYENNYFVSKNILLNKDEFDKKIKIKTSAPLIIQLIKKNNISLNEIAIILNRPIKRIEDIINRTHYRYKFYLFEIQKLRNKYFNNYTLEELAHV